MDKLRESLDQTTADLASRLDQIDLKVEQKLLSYLYDLMNAQSIYFQRGYEIFKAIKPRMDQLKLHIDTMEKVKESSNVKEGYLLQMNQNRVKNKWSRNWFVLRDGLFFCKQGKASKHSLFWKTCFHTTKPDDTEQISLLLVSVLVLQEVDHESILDILLCTVRIPAAKERSGLGLKESKYKFEIMTPGLPTH